MKTCGAIACELGNFILMRYARSNLEIIESYVAMAIVGNAEFIISLTVNKVEMVKEMNSKPVMYDVSQEFSTDKELIELWIRHDLYNFEWFYMIFGLLFHRILRYLYVVVYFYFLPFLVIMLVEINPTHLEKD